MSLSQAIKIPGQRGKARGSRGCTVSIFEQLDYRAILKSLLNRTRGVGIKSKLAKSIGCQAAYISRVLAGQAELSTDQLCRAADFFHLTESEKEFWLYILLENRATDKHTKELFLKRAKEVQGNVKSLKNRLRASSTLDSAYETQYYRSWALPALHIATRIEALQTVNEIAAAFSLSPDDCLRSLRTLVKIGAVEEKDGQFRSLKQDLHLGVDSPWLPKHHMNWRIKTAGKMMEESLEGLHYSSVISCSKADLDALREIFTEAISKSRGIVQKSADELVAHYAIDLYTLAHPPAKQVGR